MTTTLQNSLVETLAARKINAVWAGNTLRIEATIKKVNGKQMKQAAELHFDDAATLDGPAVGQCRGTYGEAFARDAFFEAILLGQGEAGAVRYNDECRARGTRSGASQAWLEAHPASELVC